MSYKLYAFLDVLGYKQFIEDDERKNTESFKDKLQLSFQYLQGFNKADISYKSISDSLFIAYNDFNNIIYFLEILKNIFINFMENGLLIRGGTSFNKHFENDTITYSQALSEAYQLEQSATYPRILINTNIIEIVKNKGSLSTLQEKNLIRRDGNIYQLHIIDNSNWIKIYSKLKDMIEKNSNDIKNKVQIRDKYLWLQNYLFRFKPDEIVDEYQKLINTWEPL